MSEEQIKAINKEHDWSALKRWWPHLTLVITVLTILTNIITTWDKNKSDNEKRYTEGKNDNKELKALIIQSNNDIINKMNIHFLRDSIWWQSQLQQMISLRDIRHSENQARFQRHEEMFRDIQERLKELETKKGYITERKEAGKLILTQH